MSKPEDLHEHEWHLLARHPDGRRDVCLTCGAYRDVERKHQMYKYSEIKPRLFTEDGQVMFLAIRDNTHRLLKLAGAARMQEAISGCGGGDTWNRMACVDRLVELGELREITDGNVAGQDRVFVSNRHDA